MGTDTPRNSAAYATVADLEARWHELSDAERQRADVLLEDAAVFLQSVIARYGIDAASRIDALRVLSCDLVQRKMESPSGAPLSSTTMQAGSFMQTNSYAIPSRKFRLYPEDLELLGVDMGGKAACFFPYATGGAR